MQIVFVTPEFITEYDFDGGLANYIHRASLALKMLGHEPIVVVSSHENETIHYNGIEVHRVCIDNVVVKDLDVTTHSEFNIPLQWLGQSWELNKTVKAIHAQKPISIVQYTNYQCPSIFRPKNIPAVIRLSSYQPMWHYGYGQIKLSFSQEVLESLEMISFTTVDGLFGPSSVIAKAVQEAIGKEVTVLESPFVLDITEVNEEIYKEILQHKNYLLFFGSIGLLKGVGTIAEIIYDVLDRHKDLYFIFIGKECSAPGEFIEYVYSNAREHRDRVLRLDKMRHEYLYPIINNAHAVVLPSLIDNFPNTCLEAMAHKRVVIGTRGASFEQLINDGESGFLCERDNPVDLLKTINRVMTLTDAERGRIGMNACERIKKLAPDRVVNDLIGYYERIINSHQRI